MNLLIFGFSNKPQWVKMNVIETETAHTHSSKPSQIDIEEGRKGISTKSVELNAENETEKK